jgi:nucleoside-diphosphate-sugar epimerase
MKVLFIGGTGIISSACSRLALERGIELTLLCRGKSPRELPAGAKVLTCDIHDEAATAAALAGKHYDAVVDWIAFVPEHIERDLRLFSGKTDQFFFISSASAYQTPPLRLPITESTLLANPVWQYSRNKIACEERLVRAFREEGFPYTIIRPSHTYDKTLLPGHGGWSVVDRMRRGLPVVVHGDGTSLWVLTHHADFAKGLVGLLGNVTAVGEAFHITSDELLTWDRIMLLVGRAAGVQPKLVHVPSEVIARHDREWGDSLLGDKTHSVIFDNSKLRTFVPDYAATIPFARGAQEIIAWYDADPSRKVVDPTFNALQDKLIALMG